jgi:hypothetical protein
LIKLTNFSSIIGIPAIGADPQKSFIVNDQPWFEVLYQDIPNARIFLYDHLTKEEREIEKKPQGHANHKASIEQYAKTEGELAQYGIEEWAERFLQEISHIRDSNSVG